MISSILKAIDVIGLFSSSEPRLTLAEISSRLELPKSTVHHILNTLLSRGFIEKLDGGYYSLGTAIIVLTQAVRLNVELRDRAAPLLRQLAQAYEESVYLAIRDGEDRELYIYAIESPQRLLARTAVGDRVLLHCTATGKAILAWLSEKEVRDIFAETGLTKFTQATIINLDRLCSELEQTRSRGYAIDKGEHEAGLHCIGAPILDDSGKVVGACSLSGADSNIVGSRLPELASHITYTAQEISRRMGYVPPTLALVANQHLRLKDTQAST